MLMAEPLCTAVHHKCVHILILIIINYLHHFHCQTFIMMHKQHFYACFKNKCKNRTCSKVRLN